MPTSVKQIFVTSDFTMMLFIYRKVAFWWCLLVPVDGGLPILCDFSSANMRLLTLVMTTLGQVYHGGDMGGFVTSSFRNNSNTSSTEAESGHSTFARTVSEQADEIRAETPHGHFRTTTDGPAPVLLHLWGFREWLQAAPCFYYKLVLPSLSLRSHQLL